MQYRATVLAEMQLFDPPAPLQGDDEASLSISRWLQLADEIVMAEDQSPIEQPA